MTVFNKLKGVGINQILANDTIFYSLVVLLVGVASFGLGRQSVAENIADIGIPEVVATEVRPASSREGGDTGETLGAQITKETTSVVGSRNSDKYHYPWCPGAKQISELNKVTFESIKEAEAAGYVPAANCKGL